MSCAYKPEPITYMDIPSTITHLKEPERTLKKEEVSKLIKVRREKLVKYNNDIITYTFLIALSGGPIALFYWCSFLPATHYHKKEIKSLNAKEDQLKELDKEIIPVSAPGGSL